MSSSSSKDTDAVDDTNATNTTSDNYIVVSINGDDYNLDRSSWTGSFDSLGRAHGGGVLTVTIVFGGGGRLDNTYDDDACRCDTKDKCYDLTEENGNETDDHTCNNDDDDTDTSYDSNRDSPMALIDVYQCVLEHGVMVGPILVHLADGGIRYTTCDEDGLLHGACVTTTSDGVVMMLDHFEHGMLSQLRPLGVTAGAVQVAQGSLECIKETCQSYQNHEYFYS